MEQPKATVVIVSYNHERFVKECLNSIKNQTYGNLELIIADDCSTDASVEVIEKWLKQENIEARTFFHHKNIGLSATLNECIEHVKGKYVKFLAADDFLHPQSIEKCVEKLERMGENYGMVFTDIWCVNNESETIRDYADYDKLGLVDPAEFRKKLVQGNRIAALSVLLRTEAVLATGKYDDQFIIEDYYRWLKINEKYFTAYVPEKLAYYRQHDSNISVVKKERIALEEIWLKMMFDKNGVNKDVVNSFIFSKYASGSKMPSNFLKEYYQYPFRAKRLEFVLKYGIPPKIYFLLKRVVKR